MSEQPTVARLLNFTTPLNEGEIEKLKVYVEAFTDFQFEVKGKQYHLTLPVAPRLISEEFIDEIDKICKFLWTGLKRPYDGDCYEVDY